MKKLLTLVAMSLLALGAIGPAAGAGLTRHYPVGRVHGQAKPLCVGERRAQHSAFRFHPAGPLDCFRVRQDLHCVHLI
jgi:hypothetical protein